MTIRYLLLSALILVGVSVPAQGPDPSSGKDTLYTLDGDTLRTDAGFQFYVGQRLIVGKGSDEHGWYRAIGFRSATAWPLLLFHDMEMKNDYQYQSDGEGARDRDKVRQSLDSGQRAVVTRIKRKGGPKHGYIYWVLFKTKDAPGLRFRCNITAAIRSREMLLPGDEMIAP